MNVHDFETHGVVAPLSSDLVVFAVCLDLQRRITSQALVSTILQEVAVLSRRRLRLVEINLPRTVKETLGSGLKRHQKNTAEQRPHTGLPHRFQILCESGPFTVAVGTTIADRPPHGSARALISACGSYRR